MVSAMIILARTTSNIVGKGHYQKKNEAGRGPVGKFSFSVIYG